MGVIKEQNLYQNSPLSSAFLVNIVQPHTARIAQTTLSALHSTLERTPDNTEHHSHQLGEYNNNTEYSTHQLGDYIDNTEYSTHQLGEKMDNT